MIQQKKRGPVGMKKHSKKQTLAATDEPIPVPANVLGLDLAHAVASFQPGTHDMEDISRALPIVSKKSRMNRNLGQNNQKRVSSMPILLERTEKELPIPQQKQTQHIPLTGKQPKHTEHKYVPYTEKKLQLTEHKKKLPFPEQEHSYKTLAQAAIPMASYNQQYPAPINNPDSVELGTIASGFTTKPDTVSQRYRPIIEVIQTYKHLDFSANSSATSSVVSLSYVDIDLKAEVTSELSSNYEDSLFSNNSSRSHTTQRCTSTPPLASNREEKPLPYPPPHTVQYDESDYFTAPLTIAAKKMAAKEEQTNMLPLAELPQTKTELPAVPEPKPIIAEKRAEKSIYNPKVRSKSQNNRLSTYSNFSIRTSVTLHEAKEEIKKIALLKPFKYCLDSGKDYEFSKFSIPKSKKRYSSYTEQSSNKGPEKQPRAVSMYYPPRAQKEQLTRSISLSDNQSNEALLTSFVNKNRGQIMSNLNRELKPLPPPVAERRNRFQRFFS